MHDESRPKDDLARRASAVCGPHPTIDFHRFWLEHYSPLCRYFRACGYHGHDAEELAQEALLVFWQKRDHVEPGKEKHFLFSVASRLGKCYRRDERAKRRTEAFWGEIREALLPDVAPPPDEAHIDAEVHRCLREALAQLPDRMREEIELVYFAALPRRDVAKAMGIARRNVYKAEKRALALLREALRGSR